MGQPTVLFEVIWKDYDLLEVRVTADSVNFRGTGTGYTTSDELFAFASELDGFPGGAAARASFAVRPGSNDSVRVDLYCLDGAGHVAVQVEIGEKLQGQLNKREEQASITFQVEPMAVASFRSHLIRMAKNREGKAILLSARE